MSTSSRRRPAHELVSVCQVTTVIKQSQNLENALKSLHSRMGKEIVSKKTYKMLFSYFELSKKEGCD